jgi:3-hydroxyacyl-[acyl-carrier-protein] dehydratase
MPPQLLFDISGIDLNTVLFDQDAIRGCNLQRGDMEQLNGIVYTAPELGRIIGFKDARADEFWVPGHVPGNPLLPGVLMIEAGAQLASFYVRKFEKWQGFVGFGGADEIRFRQMVRPGQRLYLLGQKLWERHRRFCCKIQGVSDGSMVFEMQIIGTQM